MIAKVRCQLRAGCSDRDVLPTGVHRFRTSRAAQLRGIQALVVRRVEAAAVNAIASGSQHNTIISISHRIARSQSASAPMRGDELSINASRIDDGKAGDKQ